MKWPHCAARALLPTLSDRLPLLMPPSVAPLHRRWWKHRRWWHPHPMRRSRPHTIHARPHRRHQPATFHAARTLSYFRRHAIAFINEPPAFEFRRNGITFLDDPLLPLLLLLQLLLQLLLPNPLVLQLLLPRKVFVVLRLVELLLSQLLLQLLLLVVLLLQFCEHLSHRFLLELLRLAQEFLLLIIQRLLLLLVVALFQQLIGLHLQMMHL